ncbi:pancreatic lipase-related protein 2-like protein [Trichoplusia ni ascovirus 6b]|nr:pancreatic lipase-related protein 2-like protein [Trichoplusia ni ascovirus 6b]
MFSSRIFVMMLLVLSLTAANPAWNDVFNKYGNSVKSLYNTSTSIIQNSSQTVVDGIGVVKHSTEDVVVRVLSGQCENLKSVVGWSPDKITEPTDALASIMVTLPVGKGNLLYPLSSVDDDTIWNQVLDKNKTKFFVYMHGFTDSPGEVSFKTVSDALIQAGETNIMAVDASPLLSHMYLRCTTYVTLIGRKVGEILSNLHSKGKITASNVHVIGHSLGAHMSGFIGKSFKNTTDVKLGRITALDPAGPCFGNLDENSRVSKDDAEFVDVIHTNAGVLGTEMVVGHIDFYPNGGRIQPDCFLEACSHRKAWRYFAESVKNPHKYVSYLSNDWESFQTKINKVEEAANVAYMGYGADKRAKSGKYYLRT